MDDRRPDRSKGPWFFTDAEGTRHLLQLVPMEHDPSLHDALQPQALVVETEDRRFFVIPVGADFHPAAMDREQLFQLLFFAAGGAQAECWRMVAPQRGIYIDSAGTLYRVRLAPHERSLTGGRWVDPGTYSLVFEGLDSEWVGSVLFEGESLEGMDVESIGSLLQRAKRST